MRGLWQRFLCFMSGGHDWYFNRTKLRMECHHCPKTSPGIEIKS